LKFVVSLGLLRFRLCHCKTKPQQALASSEIAMALKHSNGERMQLESCNEVDVLALKKSNALLMAVNRIQKHLINNTHFRQYFDELLNDFLTLTSSDSGFVGEVLRRTDGTPYLKVQAITNFAWDHASRILYETSAAEGFEFANLNTLFGAALHSGEVLISNDPANDLRSGGTPAGHPKLSAFLCIPVYSEKKLVGMVGLANKPRGYHQADVDYLQPLIDTYAQVLAFNKSNERRFHSEQQLKQSEYQFRQLAETIQDVFWIISPDGNELIYISPAYEKVWGRSCESLYNNSKDWMNAIHPDDVSYIAEAYSKIEYELIDEEYRVIRPDQSVCWIRDRGFPIRNESGEIYRIARIAQDITAHKKAEEELEETQSRLEETVKIRTEHLTELNYLLEATFSSLTDAVFVTDSESCEIISCNQAAENIFSYTSEELLGQHIKLLHSDKYCFESCMSLVMNSISKKSVFHAEYKLKRKNGEIFPVENTVTEIKNNHNRRTAFVSVIRDITSRKRAERALKESENKWRSLTQYSPDHIIMTELNGTILFINHVTAGVERERVVGTLIYSYLSKKFRHIAKSCYRRVIETGQADRFETVVLVDGESRYFEAHVGPVKQQEEVTALIINARDITERKNAEVGLRQLATVVENTAEAVMVTDSDNQIVAVNRAFSEITGYSTKEAIGLNPRFLKSEKHSPDFYADMWNNINQSGTWQGEIWDRRKNGEIFPAWSTVSTINDSDGNLVNYVSIFSDISTIKRSQEQLDFLAHHDPLTSLPNRLLFNDRLEHALSHAERERHQLAVFFLDLDRFKNVNDSLGHPVGDQLLQLVAERITNTMRKEDTVARLGGDEFIILIEEVKGEQDVGHLAQKIIQVLSTPFSISGLQLHLSASIGISLYPQDGQEGNTLVMNADAAMYRAKEEGRNNYQFYTMALTEAVFERLTLETALRQALPRNELVLHYQPQYSLDTNTLVGVEALIRWQHPELGLVVPAKFIPLAEECGLIESIGEWVLRTACKQMQKWLNVDASLQRIAVNVSGLQFQRQDLATMLQQILLESKLHPKYLELEITEGYLMQKTESAIQVLDKIKQLGVSISVDDFGTGYSSLSYLKRLPLDKLKIDQSFIRDIPNSPNDEAIARAIVALGQSLQLSVIAEGIETEAQNEFLKELGCDEGQGFFYGNPLPAEEVLF